MDLKNRADCRALSPYIIDFITFISIFPCDIKKTHGTFEFTRKTEILKDFARFQKDKLKILTFYSKNA